MNAVNLCVRLRICSSQTSNIKRYFVISFSVVRSFNNRFDQFIWNWNALRVTNCGTIKCVLIRNQKRKKVLFRSDLENPRNETLLHIFYSFWFQRIEQSSEIWNKMLSMFSCKFNIVVTTSAIFVHFCSTICCRWMNEWMNVWTWYTVKQNLIKFNAFSAICTVNFIYGKPHNIFIAIWTCAARTIHCCPTLRFYVYLCAHSSCEESNNDCRNVTTKWFVICNRNHFNFI